MSNELQAQASTGLTIYVVLRNRAGSVYNTSTALFEVYAGANWANYAITMTEQGTSGFYAGSLPAIASTGTFSGVVYARLGGTPAITDQALAAGDVQSVAATDPATALKVASASVAGATTGAFTGTELFKDLGSSGAFTVTLDSSGNRTSVSYVTP